MSFVSIARAASTSRLAVLAILTGVIVVGSAVLPPPSFAHRHERDVCGSDVNDFASGLLSLVGPSVAQADSFKVRREADACGDLERKSTFFNRTDSPGEHTFRKSRSRSTEFSVEVSQ